MFLDESILNEDSFKDKIEDTTETIRETKEKIENMDSVKFINEHKNIFNFITSLLLNWVKQGAILGPMVIPFTLTMTLLNLLVKKSAKYLKNEADKRFVVERIKMEISYLVKIKNNNKNNSKLISKIDSCIDFCNNVINELIE